MCPLSIFWSWAVTIYVFRLPFWWTVFLTITEKDSHPLCSSSPPSSQVKLSSICCRSGLWVLSCAIVSHSVVGCSSQYWCSSSSLDFGLCYELHLLGLGHSLVVFDVVFLFVGLPSIVHVRLAFQDLVFSDLTSMLSFIAWVWFHGLLILFCLPFPLCSLISFHLSSLIASLVALSFDMFPTPGLDGDFLVYVMCV